jgi:hypothetical protein
VANIEFEYQGCVYRALFLLYAVYYYEYCKMKNFFFINCQKEKPREETLLGNVANTSYKTREYKSVTFIIFDGL